MVTQPVPGASAIIVHAEGTRLRLVTQSDHAHLSCAVLGLWRDDGLPSHPRRQALLFAAREHDNGWREADAAPQVNPATGRPYDFSSLPQNHRREIWRRGTERHVEQHPLAALLILEHALALHSASYEDPDWRPLLDRWRELRETLLESVDLGPASLAEDYRFLAVADAVALAGAGGTPGFDLHGHRGRRRSGVGATEIVELEPFPLAGATTFRLPCRHVPDRTYTHDGDLALAAATARWEEVSVRLVPGEPDGL